MARLTVRVTPRSSRDEVVAVGADGVVRVRVTAAPVDGAANAAVARVLAEALGLPARDVVRVSGGASRTKVFEVSLGEDELKARLSATRRPKPG